MTIENKRSKIELRRKQRGREEPLTLGTSIKSRDLELPSPYPDGCTAFGWSNWEKRARTRNDGERGGDIKSGTSGIIERARDNRCILVASIPRD